jgi:hypothetical protein
LRYDRRPLRRFLLLALPLLILTMGVFQFAMEMLGLQVDPSQLGDGIELPGYVSLATWTLEALGLAALFLLVDGRSGGRGGGWTSGLLTGWIAWVFRGPLLVVTVVGLAGLSPRPWWSLVLSWWVLYSLCGLLLSGVAAGVGLGVESLPPAEPVPEISWSEPVWSEPVRPEVEPVEEPAQERMEQE